MKTPKRFDPKAATASLAVRLSEAQPGEKIIQVPVRQIIPDPDQDRKYFDEAKIQQLADSIKATGQELPIVVRPIKHKTAAYMVVSGERRWRACHLNGIETVKAVVRDLSDADREEIIASQAAENWQRENLNARETVKLALRVVGLFGLPGAVAKTGKPKQLLSKLTTVGKATGAVKSCLDESLCEDTEALYRLSRLSKRDEASAMRLVNSWRNYPDKRTGQRLQVDQALNRMGSDDSETAAANVPSKTSTAGTRTEAFTSGSRATHGIEGRSSATRTGSATDAAGEITSRNRRAAQAQPEDDADGSAPSPLRVLRAEFIDKVVILHTPDGPVRFDRASLVSVLDLDA